MRDPLERVYVTLPACPKCHGRMIRMVDTDQRHIWIESCSVCSKPSRLISPTWLVASAQIEFAWAAKSSPSGSS